MSIYLISGPIASGKGLLSEQISKIYGEDRVEVFVLSDILREMAKSRGLPITRDTLKKLGKELREKNHPGILGEMIIPSIKKAIKEARAVIVDSVRNPAEAEVISSYFTGKTRLIFIDAPVEVRLKRVRQRARIDDMAMEDIEEVIQKELEEYPFKEIREKTDIFVDGELNRELMREFIVKSIEKLQEHKTELTEEDKEFKKELWLK